MYLVNCHACATSYDALAAVECDCLHPVRSYRCPNCSKCFCEAGKRVHDEFWRGAPRAMWERRRAPRANAVPTDQNEPPETIRRPVVLFADDDPVGRLIARQIIASLGFGVVAAPDGRQALELARRYQPDLIVTDALMPRLDGREMSRIVKEERPRTKVVVITSVYKDARYRNEALRSFHVDEYLQKPIKPDELRAVVEKYLRS
jgi:CheY-like chemotaxis protein